ncbi:unnamed protein product, partial [Mycena citricolor]
MSCSSVMAYYGYVRQSLHRASEINLTVSPLIRLPRLFVPQTRLEPHPLRQRSLPGPGANHLEAIHHHCAISLKRYFTGAGPASCAPTCRALPRKVPGHRRTRTLTPFAHKCGASSHIDTVSPLVIMYMLTGMDFEFTSST